MNFDLVTSIAPEIGMAVLALAVLLLDVTLLRDWEPARRGAWLGLITALGLGGVLAILVQHMVWAEGYAHGVMYADSARILVVDQLGLMFKIVVIVLTIGTVLLSIGYEFTKHVGEYFCLLVFAAIGMQFLITTESFLMFFVALELLSICLYILTAFHKGLLRSAEAAVKYFMFGALSSAFLLFGLSWVVGSTGATDMRALAVALQSAHAASSASLVLVVGLVFIIVGIGFKIAIVPFHLWAPDAYEGAPTPVAAFIATGSKVAAFVIGAKVLLIGLAPLAGSALWTASGPQFVPGWTMLLAILGSVSMVWGNVAAIVQKNVKRLLAYSSIAHAGYILIGLIAMSAGGLTAIGFYLVTYSLANLGAFGVVAALTRAAGGDDLEDLDGMAQRSPVMSLLLLVFVLSLAGIPPLAGFLGKFLLFGAAVTADSKDFGLMWLVVIALATSAVSLYYYLTLLKHVYIHAPRTSAKVRVAFASRATLIVLALAVLGLGVWPEPMLALLNEVVEQSAFTLR